MSFLENKPTCCCNLILNKLVVDTNLQDTVLHIAYHTHTCKERFLAIAAHTCTEGKGSNTSYEASRYNLSSKNENKNKNNLLLGIVSRISEDAWIQATRDTIAAIDHNAVNICVSKFFIQNDTPDSLKELSLAMSQ